eukprot:scaffold1182_cov124-Isochrysis_galbana.AAC.17
MPLLLLANWSTLSCTAERGKSVCPSGSSRHGAPEAARAKSLDGSPHRRRPTRPPEKPVYSRTTGAVNTAVIGAFTRKQGADRLAMTYVPSSHPLGASRICSAASMPIDRAQRRSSPCSAANGKCKRVSARRARSSATRPSALTWSAEMLAISARCPSLSLHCGRREDPSAARRFYFSQDAALTLCRSSGIWHAGSWHAGSTCVARVLPCTARVCARTCAASGV